jgi:hypothetical protein
VPEAVRGCSTGAAGSFSGIRQGPEQRPIQSVMAPASRQQQAFGFRQSRGWCQCAQSQHASHDPSDVIICRHQAFGVQLAKRDMQCPLIHGAAAGTLRPSMPSAPGEIEMARTAAGKNGNTAAPFLQGHSHSLKAIINWKRTASPAPGVCDWPIGRSSATRRSGGLSGWTPSDKVRAAPTPGRSQLSLVSECQKVLQPS